MHGSGTSPRDLDIIIPVYNEGRSILATLSEVVHHVTSSARVLIVYDFESDTSIPALSEFTPHKNIEVIPVLNTLGRGVCNALKFGLGQVTVPAVVIVMGDLSDDLSSLPRMYELFTQGNSVVCASRYLQGGRQIGGPITDLGREKSLPGLCDAVLLFFPGPWMEVVSKRDSAGNVSDRHHTIFLLVPYA